MTTMRTFVMLLVAPLLGNAVPNLSCVVNSAPAPSQLMTVNADVLNQADDEAASSARLFFSLDTQLTWNEASMGRIGTPGYDSTFQAPIPLRSSGAVYYYVRGEGGGGYATQAPYNGANAWPPGDNLTASLANEPSGDAIDPEGDWLDLTGAFVGYSADRFYVMLTNNHTSWPLYSFPQPWYIYSLGFVNPAAASDTWIFTLSYANIPGVFTTGIYLINRFTTDYTRIAGAEAQTSGNRLYLRANIADLTGHPRFGPWPNPQGFLHAAATTQAIYPIGGSRLRDSTNGARFYAPRTPRVAVGRNTAPQLLNPLVTPDTGSPLTNFRFSVSYIDADSNLPVLRRVIVDTDTLELLPSRHQYWLGVGFDRVRSGFGPGRHRFRFEFDDGMSRVITPMDSFEVFGTGLLECGSRTLSRGNRRIESRPNPFRGRVLLSWDPPSAGPGAELRISDAAGRCVRRLHSATTSCLWDGTDEQGRSLPAGLYWVLSSEGGGTFRAAQVLLRR